MYKEFLSNLGLIFNYVVIKSGKTIFIENLLLLHIVYTLYIYNVEKSEACKTKTHYEKSKNKNFGIKEKIKSIFYS